MTILIPVLAMILLVLVRRPLNAPAATQAETFDAEPTMSAAAEDVQIDWELPPVYRVTGRDPMGLGPLPEAHEEPVAGSSRAHEALDVKGVLYSEDNPAAIVGTRLVHEGEQIAGATVIAIERDGVRFERNGQRWKQTVSALPVLPGQETGESPEDGS